MEQEQDFPCDTVFFQEAAGSFQPHKGIMQPSDMQTLKKRLVIMMNLTECVTGFIQVQAGCTVKMLCMLRYVKESRGRTKA